MAQKPNIKNTNTSTKRKRKTRVIKKTLKRNTLIRNLLIVLLIALIVFGIVSFFTYKQESAKSINNKTPITTNKYTNEEVMKEVISTLDSQKQDKSLKNIEEQKKEKSFLEYQKKIEQDYENTQKKALQEIKEDKERKKEKEPSVYKIEEEIIGDTSKIKEKDKKIITKKDTYKHDSKTKPKLVIIIDDVVTLSQKNKILNIGYPITMSFLPPNIHHKNSAKIAQDLPFYMIHFPMQASKNFKNTENETLNILDSYEDIEKKVKQLREWYPQATYTNNHTGSVFTSNYDSMDKLFKALKKYNFIFVDSRTTAESVAKELTIKYDMPYIARNIFLDNERTFSAIQKQLKTAIKTAKKDGYAIAIGHPYDITIQVLKESKSILKDIEPIFLNQLPYL